MLLVYNGYLQHHNSSLHHKYQKFDHNCTETIPRTPDLVVLTLSHYLQLLETTKRCNMQSCSGAGTRGNGICTREFVRGFYSEECYTFAINNIVWESTVRENVRETVQFCTIYSTVSNFLTGLL